MRIYIFYYYWLIVFDYSILGSFPFDGLWKNNWKIHISIVFVHDLSENQLHFLEKWELKNYELLKLLISYVFVKKSNFFFLFLNVIFRFFKGFRLCIVDTRRWNINFFSKRQNPYNESKYNIEE